MENVILAVHILACIAMTVAVLLQRSEGGALGMGGGGGGSMFSGRGAASALVRTTMILGGMFFLTSLVLTTLAARNPERSAVERAVAPSGEAPALMDALDPDTDLLGDPLADDGTPGDASGPGTGAGAGPDASDAAPEAEPGEVDPFADEPADAGNGPG